MTDPVLDPRSSSAIMDLVLPLSLSHPSILALLDLKPLSRPSVVSHSHLTKFVGRVNVAVLGREGEGGSKTGSEVARRLVEDDEEGWVMSEYGKGWVTICLTELAANSTTIPIHRLELMRTLIMQSPQYPSFEREAIHPIMGKVSVTLTKVLATALSAEQTDLSSLSSLLSSLKTIISHSPVPFRPSTPSLRTLLQSLLVPSPTDTSSSRTYPNQIRETAADVLASLHLTNGKAQIPTSWSAEIKSALGGLGMALNGIVGEGWVEEAYRVIPPSAPSGYILPTDPTERLPLALQHLEGWVEAVLALLRYPTSRPVPVPVAQVVAAGLRCLNLTLDTPTLPYISPQHRASLVASLPRIWTSGLQLLAAIANSVGDHLFPHLSLILDHTVWLAETIPSSMSQTHLQLLHFHSLFLEMFPAALVPVEYPTRLLRLSLGYLSPLLEPKQRVEATSIPTGMSKRGRKRARGAEDGLVGGLEGRERAALSTAEIDIISAALSLVPLLHPAPLLSPALLTLSIRIHISIYLSLPTISHLLQPPHQADRLRTALANVLEKAALMNEGQGGTSRGWKSVILSIMEPRGDSFSILLHPSLPPLHRPGPPLSSLHFFTTETEEEKRLRLEMGFTTELDLDLESNVADGDQDEDMYMDTEITGPTATTTSAKSSTRNKRARMDGDEDGLVPVSREDSAPPIGKGKGKSKGASTTMQPPPRSSDLRIPPIGNDETLPHSTSIKPEKIVIVDTIPQIEGARRDGEDPLAPDPTFAPLHGASNDLYPEPVGPIRSGLKDQQKTFKEQEGHAVTSHSSEGRSARQIKAATDLVHKEQQGQEGKQGLGAATAGQDDEEEPMPEMDSDMDLSDEEDDE